MNVSNAVDAENIDPAMSAEKQAPGTPPRAMTAEEIQEMWRRNGNEKANMGTWAHLCMELVLNSAPVFFCSELRNGLTFLRDHLVPKGVTAFRTEWEVHADAEAFAAKHEQLGADLDSLRKQLVEVQAENREEELLLRKKTMKAEGEVRNWVAEYDKDMSFKQKTLKEEQLRLQTK